jgi:Zn-dependent alcohol dehydrogenase
VATGFGGATNTAEIAEADTVVVVGCGGVGLNVVQGARFRRAARIVAVDLVPSKLDLARSFGATDVVDARAADPIDEVMRLTDRRGADVAFEVTGHISAAEQVIRMTRRGGQSVFIGALPMDAVLPMPFTEATIVGARRLIGCWNGRPDTRRDFPAWAELYRQGVLMLDELIAREVSLDDVNEGLEALAAGDGARTTITFAS